MAKNREKRRSQNLHETRGGTVLPFKKRKFISERSPPPILALNSRQAQYLGYLRTHQQVFVLGPAGTGKTWLAATYAADLYRNRAISKIILTRPNVPCGRSLGFFPGTLENKFAPWAVPVTDAIRARLGPAVYEVAVKNGDIEVVPFEVMRGRSWSNGVRSVGRGSKYNDCRDQDVSHACRRGLLDSHQRRRRAMRSRLQIRPPQGH